MMFYVNSCSYIFQHWGTNVVLTCMNLEILSKVMVKPLILVAYTYLILNHAAINGQIHARFWPFGFCKDKIYNYGKIRSAEQLVTL